MAIKNIIAKGIGFDSGGDSTTKFIPTHGFSPGSDTGPLHRAVTGYVFSRAVQGYVMDRAAKGEVFDRAARGEVR